MTDVFDIIAAGRIPTSDTEEETRQPSRAGVGPKGQSILQLRDTPAREPDPADTAPKNRYGRPIKIRDVPDQPDLGAATAIEEQEDWEKQRSAGIRRERLMNTPTSLLRDVPLDVVKGFGGVIESAGQIADWATGGYDPIFAPSFKAVGKDIQKYAGSLQTEAKQFVDEELDFWDWERPGAKIGGMLTQAVPSLVSLAAMGKKLATGIAAGLTRYGGQRGAAIAAGETPTIVGTGTAGAAINAGDLAGQIEEDVLKAPEATLQQGSKYYRDLREQGKSDQEARQLLVREAQGWKPLFAGMVGALSGYGIDATMANFLAGKLSTQTFLQGARSGMFKEAGQEFAENAGNSYLAQKAKVEQGLQKEIDWTQVFKEGTAGGIVGGILGGAVGGVARRRGPQTVPNTAQDPDVQAALNQPAQLPPPPGGSAGALPAPAAPGPPGGLPGPTAPLQIGARDSLRPAEETPDVINQGMAPQPLALPPPEAPLPPREMPSSPYTGPQEQGAPIAAGAADPGNRAVYQEGLTALMDAARGGPEGDFEGPVASATGSRNQPKNPQFIEQLARGLWAEAGGDPRIFRQLIQREQARIMDSLAEPELYAGSRRKEAAEQDRVQQTAQQAPTQIRRALEERGIGMGERDMADVTAAIQTVMRNSPNIDQLQQAINGIIMQYTPQEQEGGIPEQPWQRLRGELPALRATTPERPKAREYPPPLKVEPEPPPTPTPAVSVKVPEKVRRAIEVAHQTSSTAAAVESGEQQAKAAVKATHVAEEAKQAPYEEAKAAPKQDVTEAERAPSKPSHKLSPEEEKETKGQLEALQYYRRAEEESERAAPTPKPAVTAAVTKKGTKAPPKVYSRFGAGKDEKHVYSVLAARGVEVDKPMSSGIEEAIKDLPEDLTPGQRSLAVNRIITRFANWQERTYEQAETIAARETEEQKKESAEAEKAVETPGTELVAPESFAGKTWAEIKKFVAKLRDTMQRDRAGEATAPDKEALSGKIIDNPFNKKTEPKKYAAREELRRQQRARRAWTFLPPENWPKDAQTMVAMVQYSGGKVDMAIAEQIRDAVAAAHEENQTLRAALESTHEETRAKALDTMEQKLAKLKADVGRYEGESVAVEAHRRQSIAMLEKALAAPQAGGKAQIKQSLERDFTRAMLDIVAKFGAPEGRFAVAQKAYEEESKLPGRTVTQQERDEEEKRAAAVIHEALRQPTTKETVDYFEAKLRAEFNAENVDNEWITTDEISRLIKSEMKNWRKSITKVLEGGDWRNLLAEAEVAGEGEWRNAILRTLQAQATPLPDLNKLINANIQAAILQQSERNRRTGEKADETERDEKIEAGVPPLGTERYAIHPRSAKAHKEMIADLLRRRTSEERYSEEKGLSPEAILEQDVRTVKRQVAEAMKQEDPPVWAKALDNAFKRLAGLTNARKNKKERQRIEREIRDIKVARARAVLQMEMSLSETMPKPGAAMASMGRISQIRAGVSQYLQGKGYPDPLAELKENKGALMNIPPSAVEAEQAKRRIAAADPIAAQVVINEKQRDILWSVLETHQPQQETQPTKTRLKGRIKKGEQVIRALKKKKQPETRIGKYTTEETDEQALDRWETIVNEADKSLTDAGMTQIGKNFNSASPIEMNMLVLMKRAVKAQLKYRFRPSRETKTQTGEFAVADPLYGPGALSPFVQNVRGLEAMLRLEAVTRGDRSEAAFKQMAADFNNAFSDAIERSGIHQTGTDAAWDALLEARSSEKNWEDASNIIEQIEATKKAEAGFTPTHPKDIAAVAEARKVEAALKAKEAEELLLWHANAAIAGVKAPEWDPKTNKITFFRKKGAVTPLTAASTARPPPVVARRFDLRMQSSPATVWIGDEPVHLQPSLAPSTAAKPEGRYPASGFFDTLQAAAFGRPRLEQGEETKAQREARMRQEIKDENDRVTNGDPRTTDAMLAGVLDFDPKTAKPAALDAGSYRASDLLNRALRQMRRTMEGFFPTGIGNGLKFIRRAIANRLNTLVGNMEMEVVSYRMFNEKGEEIAAQFVPSISGRPRIQINQQHFNTLSAAQQAWVLQHEMTHGATSTAYNINLNGARAIFDALYSQAKRSEIGSDPRFEYAMRGPKEFIAEVRANPDLQEAMAMMDSPGPAGMPSKMSMWRRFVQAVQNVIGAAFGGRPAENYLTYVLASSEESMLSTREQMAGEVTDQMRAQMEANPLPGTASETDPLGVDPMIASTIDNVVGAFKARSGGFDALRSGGFWNKIKAAGLGFEGTSALGRWARQNKLYMRADGSNALEDWAAAFERVDGLVDLLKEQGTLLATKVKQYIKTVPEALKAVDILYNASLWGYDPRYDLNHPANAHLIDSPDGINAAKRQSHARDNADWNTLAAETQATMNEVVGYYQQTQKLLAGVIARNIISADIANGTIMTPVGVTRDTFIAYALSGRLNKPDAQKTAQELRLDALLGDGKERLSEAMRIAKTEGIYLPFTRDGDYVVRGRIKVPRPPGVHRAVPDQPNSYTFASQQAAASYAKTLETMGVYNTMQEQWVDAQGNRVKKSEAGALKQYAVIAQDRHVEFFDSYAEAQAFADEARTSGDFHEIKNAELVGDKFGLLQEIRPAHIESMYKSIQQNDHHSPTTRAALTRALDELQLRSMSGYRVQKHRMRRRNTRGFDKDMPGSLFRYSASMAQHIGETARAPELAELENEVLGMHDQILQNGTPSDGLASQRLVKEMQKRQTVANVRGNNFSNQLKAVSYMHWLGSTAASILNGTQVIAVTAPVLYGKYNAGDVVKSIRTAYRDIGAFAVLKHAFSQTLAETTNWSGEENSPNPVGPIVDRVSGDRQRMLKEAQRQNKLSKFAGIEFEQFSDQGLVSKGISYASRIASALPQAIESINRSVALLATYDLARAAGKSHEVATAEAIKVVDETQIDMTRRGRGRYFNHPFWGLPLQFKQFSAAMISLWARNLAAVVGKNATPQEKKEARRTLIALSMVTVMLSGLSGLPWDLAKAMVTAAWLLGAEDDWEDYESGVQQFITGLMGGAGGEFLTRGLVRSMGIEVSNRIGYDAMILGQLPRERTGQAMATWFAQQVFGAPGAMAGNTLLAAQAGMSGKWGEALEKAPLPKLAGDLVRAMRGYSEGRESPTGLKLQTEYTGMEAIWRALGFTPAREAESWEVGTAAKYKQTKKANKRLGELKNEWARAETTSEKQAAWEKIKELNEANRDTRDYNPADMGSLYKYKKGLTKRQGERLEQLREDEEEIANS